jgi:hypothetical protein
VWLIKVICLVNYCSLFCHPSYKQVECSTPFHCWGKSSLCQIELISLCIPDLTVFPLVWISFAGSCRYKSGIKDGLGNFSKNTDNLLRILKCGEMTEFFNIQWNPVKKILKIPRKSYFLSVKFLKRVILMKWENFGAFLSWFLRREIFLTGYFLSEFHCVLLPYKIFRNITGMQSASTRDHCVWRNILLPSSRCADNGAFQKSHF